jgi:cold shock CspA family protein
MPTGIVKRWDGYFCGGTGVVAPDDGSRDFIVTREMLTLRNYLWSGDIVEYEFYWDNEKAKSVCSYVSLWDDGSNTVWAVLRSRRNYD